MNDQDFRKTLTVEQAIAILQQLPAKAKLGFAEKVVDYDDSEYPCEHTITLVEHRYHKDSDISEVFFHHKTPDWSEFTVEVISETEAIVSTKMMK